MRPYHGSAGKGVTLIEMVIAMGITAFILTILASSWYSATETFSRFDGYVDRKNRTCIVLHRLITELEHAVATDFEGRVAFVGEDDDLDERGADRLFFVTSATLFGKTGHLSEVEYGFNREGQFIRREDDTPDDDPREGGVMYNFEDGIESFNMRYYYKEEWYAEWNTAREPRTRLPEIVEITLKSDGKVYNFMLSLEGTIQ